jgi:hypothetical protein
MTAVGVYRRVVVPWHLPRRGQWRAGQQRRASLSGGPPSAAAGELFATQADLGIANGWQRPSLAIDGGGQLAGDTPSAALDKDPFPTTLWP